MSEDHLRTLLNRCYHLLSSLETPPAGKNEQYYDLLGEIGEVFAEEVQPAPAAVQPVTVNVSLSPVLSRAERNKIVGEVLTKLTRDIHQSGHIRRGEA